MFLFHLDSIEENKGLGGIPGLPHQPKVPWNIEKPLHLEEQLEYKGTSPRTLLNGWRAVGTLPGSEGLPSHSVCSPSTLTTRMGVQGPGALAGLPPH